MKGSSDNFSLAPVPFGACASGKGVKNWREADALDIAGAFIARIALLNPGASGARPKILRWDGRRKSASISSELLPAFAIKIARFAATELFPSPGIQLED